MVFKTGQKVHCRLARVFSQKSFFEHISKMRMDDKVVKSFCVAKSFKESESGNGGAAGKIQSLHFSLDGQNLITCSDDDQIIIYDCQKG